MAKFDYITNWNPGLGDCLSVFTTSLPVYSPSPHFKTLRKYSSLPIFRGEGVALRTELLHNKHKGQHLFNKARIEAGDAPLTNPRPLLDKIKYDPQKNVVAFSFDVGAVVEQQRAKIHPRARMLYPEYHEMFQKFVLDHPEIKFCEIGQKGSGFTFVDSIVGLGLERTINVLSVVNKFICMHSGLQHLALAIGVPTCAIVNFPAPERFLNPEEQETDWLEPQVTYLHEDGGSEKVKSLNRENLEKFLNMPTVFGTPLDKLGDFGYGKEYPYPKNMPPEIKNG